MDFKEALKVIDELVLAKVGRRLNQLEITVIEAAWKDKDYKEIAEDLSYDTNLLQRRVAPKLWVLLTGVLENGEKVTKKRLRGILEQRMTRFVAHCSSDISDTSQFTPSNTSLCILGGQPPEVSKFYGRVPELAMIRESIVEDRCVALIGAAGIGKSNLAAKLIEVVRTEPQSGFDCLIWKSVSYAPLLQDLVTDLLGLLALPSELNLPESTQGKVTVLIEYLQSRRCLVVLDAAEAVLQGDRNTSFNPYGEQYAEYGVFLRRIIEEQHQSCLILTSREPFIDITRLQRKGQPARTVKVEGLGKEALQILRAKGLTDENEWGNLVETYRGNPLALQMVASRIQDFFGGSVEEFFKCKTMLIGDLFQETLDELFGTTGRLTNLEKQIMFYLAKELAKGFDSITFTQLLSEIKIKEQLEASTSKLIEALEALGERSLVEKKTSTSKEVLLSLQPVVRKYVLTYSLGGAKDFFQTFKSA